MWKKADTAVASIAETAGFLARFAVLLAWDAAKVLALVACGVVVIGVPLVAAYRWAGGSPLRYAGAAAVVIGTLIYVPDRLLRWQRMASAQSKQVVIRRLLIPVASLSLFCAAALSAQSVPVAPGTRFGVWTFAASSDSGEAAYFVDLSNAKRTRNGARVKAWIKLVHADLQPLPPNLRTTTTNWNGETTFRYVLLDADFDCVKRQVRGLAVWYFDDHGRAVSDVISPPTEGWTVPPPETTLAQVLDMACAR